MYYHMFVVWLALKEKPFLIWLEKQPYTLMEKKKYISIIKANWIEALVLCDMVNIFLRNEGEKQINSLNLHPANQVIIHSMSQSEKHRGQ